MKILSTDEAALVLKLHPVTLTRLARDGRVPASKVGREWRFVEEHLSEWLRKGYAPFADQDRVRKVDQCVNLTSRSMSSGQKGLGTTARQSKSPGVAYSALLGLHTATKQSGSRNAGTRKCGPNSDLEKSRVAPGKKRSSGGPSK